MASGSPFFLRGLIKRDAKALQERKERLLKKVHEIEESISLPVEESDLLEDMISRGDHDHSVERAIEAYSRRGSVGTLYSLVHHRSDFEGKTAEEGDDKRRSDDRLRLNRKGSGRRLTKNNSSRRAMDEHPGNIYRRDHDKPSMRNLKLQRQAHSDGSGRGRGREF